jgi:hypothetical protein
MVVDPLQVLAKPSAWGWPWSLLLITEGFVCLKLLLFAWGLQGQGGWGSYF